MKKRNIFITVLTTILFFFVITNPTKQDYIEYTKFDVAQAESFDESVGIEIERINFFLFSTYAPKEKVLDHYGIVHLGFIGHFFQISKGQYDYPWWLEFFN